MDALKKIIYFLRTSNDDINCNKDEATHGVVFSLYIYIYFVCVCVYIDKFDITVLGV